MNIGTKIIIEALDLSIQDQNGPDPLQIN